MTGVSNPDGQPAQNVIIKRLSIKNFKSLKDFNIDLRKFNLIVGPNGSGKTNVIEALMLFKEIYWSMAQYANPFSRWWGYKNVVWKGNEDLPITLGLDIVAWNYDIHFEVTITGTGGKFEVLREFLEVRGILRIEREGDTVRVVHDPSFIKQKLGEGKSSRIEIPKEVQSVRIDPSKAIGQPFCIQGGSVTYVEESDVAIMTLYLPYINGEELIRLLSPTVTIPEEVIVGLTGEVKIGKRRTPLILEITDFVRFSKFVIIRQLNFKEIRTPQPIKMEALLNEDCSNLSNVFHTWILRKGKIDRIRALLESIFEEEIIPKPELTTDGRVYTRVLEREHELEPPQVPDGLWKILAIELAIESKPHLLVIDELENSLHPKAIELSLIHI